MSPQKGQVSFFLEKGIQVLRIPHKGDSPLMALKMERANGEECSQFLGAESGPCLTASKDTEALTL